jgi:uncharacterized protein (DUF2252 family)
VSKRSTTTTTSKSKPASSRPAAKADRNGNGSDDVGSGKAPKEAKAGAARAADAGGKKVEVKRIEAKKGDTKKIEALKVAVAKPGSSKRPNRTGVAALERAMGAASQRAILVGATGSVDRAGRVAAGKALRKDVPRAAHGDWTPPAGRDPIAILEEQGRSRVPDLVPIRHGRMAESAFGFYRGAAAVMAADLADAPVSGLVVQLCGDAHLLNFGLFGTPERRLIFDVNDFDESVPGPWELDLKRLAASIEVAARSRDFDRSVGPLAVRVSVRAYAAAMETFATLRTMDAWYSRIDIDAVRAAAADNITDETHAATDRAIARAQAHDAMQAVGKLTEVVRGHRRFVDKLPLVGHVPGADELGHMRALFGDYRLGLADAHIHLLDRFQLVDAARKVVGVGSVGTRCWIALLEGGAGDDPLILQVKEAQRSVLEPFVGQSAYPHHGQRVVEGQRLMQAASDLFLGWSQDDVEGIHYYWRQLRDMKGSADIASQTLETFVAYAGLCGTTLARAHARSGDAAAISGYIGGGDDLGKAFARFAIAYADQNEQDHAALVDAIASGRLPAEADV